ncbi:hypothetical protein TIFTF001_032591 [Ficus carica]|uniref:Uncharacterized protein n=1 Tax=Ficus carica TaxID=3494 RepID=A0AA88DXC4_FICCA|nr:hypothetical protein TIFTF001_032591 [Ficus carica]
MGRQGGREGGDGGGKKRERGEGGVESDGRTRGRGWLCCGRRSNEEEGRTAAASPGE